MFGSFSPLQLLPLPMACTVSHKKSSMGTPSPCFRTSLSSLDRVPRIFDSLFRDPRRYIFFALDIIGRLVSNLIYFAVVMNYVCHCEMIVFYCKTIRLRLEEKSIPLLESMKRIVDLGASISQLNSAASRMISVLLIVFLARTILGRKSQT